MKNLTNRGAFRRLAVASALALCGLSQQGLAQMDIDFDAVEIRTVPVQGNIYMLVGAGGNITVQVGEQGVLVVDTMFEPLADKVLAAIRELSDKPIQYVINTHAHGDHVGGNIPIADAGITIATGNVAIEIAVDELGSRAAIVAHENVLLDMIKQDSPFDMWPTSSFFTDSKDLHFNGEAIQILHQPYAHTDGDVIIHFRRSDVIATGDLFQTLSFPFIDVSRGGTLQGIIDAANRIIDIAVPERSQEGGTLIVPGHGRITDEFELVEYRDMLTIIRDRVEILVDEGASLDEVKDMNVTGGWNNRYGRDSGFWTTEQFVETVYRELSGQDT